MVLGCQAHSSPIGFTFYRGQQFPQRYRGDAIIGFRGSWNRSKPVGYKVVRVRFKDGKPLAFEDFLTGFLSEDGRTTFGRPCDLLELHDGSLLVSDDTGGMIYRIRYRGPPPP